MSYKVGDFGHARFPRKRNHGIEAYGKIIDIDAKYVLFKDNDGYEAIINRTKFQFEICDFEDLSKTA